MTKAFQVFYYFLFINEIEEENIQGKRKEKS